MVSLFIVLDLALGLYMWVLILSAILSWLTVFNVINNRNAFVATLGDLCFRLTEPLLRPLRRRLPLISGLDLSPLVLIFIIIFMRSLLREYGPL